MSKARKLCRTANDGQLYAEATCSRKGAVRVRGLAGGASLDATSGDLNSALVASVVSETHPSKAPSCAIGRMVSALTRGESDRTLSNLAELD